MSIKLSLDNHGSIPKIIHASWKTKDILNNQSPLILNGWANLKRLNPDYQFEISDDHDVDQYLKSKLGRWDYFKIKNKKIVEKVDLWRLFKLYHEGGIYVDIDRYCNIRFDDLIKSDTKCILPTHGDTDFSQDIMISCKHNPIFKKAIEYNLEGRFLLNPRGVFHLGPPIYMRAVTEVVFGKRMKRKPGNQIMATYRTLLEESRHFQTHKENLPFDSLIYMKDEGTSEINYELEKEEFYKSQGIVPWYKGYDKNTVLLLIGLCVALIVFFLIRIIIG